MSVAYRYFFEIANFCIATRNYEHNTYLLNNKSRRFVLHMHKWKIQMNKSFTASGKSNDSGVFSRNMPYSRMFILIVVNNEIVISFMSLYGRTLHVDNYLLLLVGGLRFKGSRSGIVFQFL